jgi:hypothetical protein
MLLPIDLLLKKTRTGRKVFLNTPQRKRLIDWVTSSKENRLTPWAEIPSILGLDCGEYAIRTAFKKEGFTRAAARRKPPLSRANRDARKAWAEEHKDWTEEQWFSILWSDETWVQPGRHTKTWITRRIGKSEVYHLDA